MTDPRPPVESAVAIHHDKEGNSAPTIMAKGKGEFAKKILEIAFENNVKVRTDADLIQLLEKIEVETEIPIEAFAAVAEILNYVYKLNNSDRAIAPHFDLNTETTEER